MTYVVSDLHGAYDRFLELLEKIRFSEEDILYVLGDIVDVGEKPMELIADLSVRTNVFPIAGEHDFSAAKMLAGFDKMLRNGATPDPEYIAEMTSWVNAGGQTTLAGFRDLDEEQREGVLDYLCDLPLFEEAEVNGEKYLLVHAGITDYEEGSDPGDYEPEDFFGKTPDPEIPLIKGVTLIVGHEPTKDHKIVRGNGTVYIDCGASCGGNLGCLCLETKEEVYV